jgi:hypothetical protein
LLHATYTPLILFAVGTLAGTLNVIAGGGSMLTLPVMIFLGLPPTVANGTNRVAIVVQSVGATWSFERKKLISRQWLALAAPPAVLGAVLGAWGAVRVGDIAFQRILAGVLVIAAVWSLWRPSSEPDGSNAAVPSGAGRWGFALAFFLVGIYGGFIQAGVGFLILAVTSAGGLDLVRGNAVKVPLALAFTTVALALFAMSGEVDWVVGASLAAGNLIGGLMGVHLTVLKGHRWVRSVVTVTTVLFAIRLLWTA